MIPRYTPKDFAALWSAERRYAVWLEVELAACAAMEAEGFVPEGASATIRAMDLRLDPARVEAIEAETRHDVIAFLTHVEELAASPARWLHRGLTSSDVLDTSFAMLLRDAADLCLTRLDRLIAAAARRVDEHRRTPMIGRSHGIHAEPITFGLALAGTSRSSTARGSGCARPATRSPSARSRARSAPTRTSPRPSRPARCAPSG
ncbi:MAG: lyase family protein [Polyangiales bacterium]